MLGVELVDAKRADAVITAALREGWILLGEGDGRVLSLTPPLTIDEHVLDGAVDRLVELLTA
jgi:4-aminobutyrate aminotransferase-like enzyme